MTFLDAMSNKFPSALMITKLIIMIYCGVISYLIYNSNPDGKGPKDWGGYVMFVFFVANTIKNFILASKFREMFGKKMGWNEKSTNKIGLKKKSSKKKG